MIQSIKFAKHINQILVSDLPFQSWNFPGGEVGFKLTRLSKSEFPKVHIEFIPNRHILISSRLTTSDSLLELMMAVDAIRKIEKDIPIRLYAPYIPYGRQDRVCDEGESFSLKVFSQLINGLGFQKIFTISPHSKTTEDLIDNLEVISIDESIRGRFLAHMDAENTVLVAPDLGAIKRTEQLAKVFLKDRKPNMIVQKLPIIFSNKKRNMATGQIIGLEVYGDVKGKKCFIVDDLIDGGRTFIELAKILKAQGATHLYLFATHGIFSKGMDVLAEYYERVYTTNSWSNHQSLQHSKLDLLDVYSDSMLLKLNNISSFA